uniref:Hexosyltransferase n=1 Tax=Ciona savignyi TaxID=51511 RepID=H2ZHF1_CIOSA
MNRFFKSKRTRAVLFLLFLLGFFSWHSKHIFIKLYHSPTVHQHVKFALPTKYATNIKEPQHIETHFVKNPTTLLFHHMKNDLVIFFVKSAPENIARRMMIRKTWGSVKYINGKQLFVVFLIGTPVNQSQHHLLDDEKQCFDDILQSTQPDTYANLTLKILGAFRWIINHLNSIRTFYIFTNDNCVINISKTIAFLRKIKERQAMYCGFQYEKQSGVIRGEGKWGVNWLQYSATEYPDFCRGVMVILTPAL